MHLLRAAECAALELVEVLHRIEPDGEHRVEVLGAAIEQGERPQIVIPAGTLQAAVTQGSGFALCGCTVSPGFAFSDFEMPARDDLLARFPRHEAIIRRFTRI